MAGRRGLLWCLSGSEEKASQGRTRFQGTDYLGYRCPGFQENFVCSDWCLFGKNLIRQMWAKECKSLDRGDTISRR